MPDTARALAVCLLALTGLLGGCASMDPRDPLEPFNREVYAFNEDFDEEIARPIAEAYERNVPQPVRTGVSNFFSNLDDVIVLANDLLQFKLRQGASDFMRVVMNTVFGLGGLIDVGTPMGLPKHDEDFGQTLATWGVGAGPYLVLPFLGPSTLRDGTGMAADWQIDPVLALESDTTRAGLTLVEVVDTRAALLGASRLLEQAALDPYAFVREAYFQRRRNLIYDGEPPPERFEDFDEDFELEPPPPAPGVEPETAR